MILRARCSALGQNAYNDVLARRMERDRTEETNSSEPDERTTERELEDALVADLEARGLLVERQVHLSAGRCDVLVFGDPVMIIECKRRAERSDLFKAAGQLVAYRQDFPDAELYIACGEPIPLELKTAFDASGIREWGL